MSIVRANPGDHEHWLRQVTVPYLRLFEAHRMEIYLGPVLFTFLGLLYMTNPLGLGDAAFRQLNRYPRIDWSTEAARRQAFVLGRTAFAFGAGALIWVLLLEFEASHPVKVAFLAVAIPFALALALFTIIDTNRRAAEQRRP